MISRLAILALVFSFIACEKEELPITPHQPGNVLIKQVDIGPDYTTQVWYRLKDHTIVSQNHKEEWDLRFEASEEGWLITTNTSKAMAVAFSGKNSFEGINLPPADEWEWDHQSGETAIGDWRGSDEVYIINLGYDAEGREMGYRLLKILSVDEDKYRIAFTDLEKGNADTLALFKDPDYNFIYFTFNEGGMVVEIEPPADQWDLLFTQYIHEFDNPPIAYQVVGVLQNQSHVEVAQDSLYTFDGINYEAISEFHFSGRSDVIGYDWKWYDFSSGIYIVDPQINFVIKSKERYFKMHFLDYYDESGETGAMTFEVQEL